VTNEYDRQCAMYGGTVGKRKYKGIIHFEFNSSWIVQCSQQRIAYSWSFKVFFYFIHY